MHYADIISVLTKAGHPPVEVARTLNVRRSTVSQVIHGTAVSHRIAKHISKVTKQPIDKLWPGKYPTDADRQRARKSRKTA